MPQKFYIFITNYYWGNTPTYKQTRLKNHLGYVDVLVHILKLLKYLLALHPSNVINECVSDIFRNNLRIAKVVPIFMSGNPY